MKTAKICNLLGPFTGAFLCMLLAYNGVMRIRKHIRSLAAWIVANIKEIGILAVASFCMIIMYTFHRVGDLADGYVGLEQELEQERVMRYQLEIRLVNLIRDKQEACRVLEATITNGEYSHTYCKGQAK